ncbi:MAG TPA: hypothetical protein VJM34_04770 [Novosphingobium sp.]|nr:hypothetical protein [Novosphingobium sp.]
MIERAGTGWQTILADLSLILFMISASALRYEKEKPPEERASAQGEPLAFYEADAGAPPIGEWLAAQSPDERQQLTIVARYGPNGQARALEEVGRLAREAQAKGMPARIVVEPVARADDTGTSAMLAYDVPGAGMARDLLRDNKAKSNP